MGQGKWQMLIMVMWGLAKGKSSIKEQKVVEKNVPEAAVTALINLIREHDWVEKVFSRRF